MKVRYKKDGYETYARKFNLHAIAEVLTGDDSAFVRDLDVFVEAKGEYVDMNEAFTNGDIITDNYNVYFFEPKTEEDRKRGYTL